MPLVIACTNIALCVKIVMNIINWEGSTYANGQMLNINNTMANLGRARPSMALALKLGTYWDNSTCSLSQVITLSIVQL